MLWALLWRLGVAGIHLCKVGFLQPQACDLCFSGGKWFVPHRECDFRAWRADCVCVPVLAGVTLAEARLGDLSCPGVVPMPRELAFPVPKGKKWHDLYDYIRYGCSHPTAAPRPPHAPGKGRMGSAT